jgi:hypothetical protein
MKLVIEIDLPEANEIISQGCPVPIARKGEPWKASCLGAMSKRKGVYVLHHAGQIIYVGMTEKPSMDFGTRLRREFQESASQGRHIFGKLCLLPTPPAIMAHFYTHDEIRERMRFNGSIPRPDWMVALFEMAMISHLVPHLQRHIATAIAKMALKYFGHAETPEDVEKLSTSFQKILLEGWEKQRDKVNQTDED